MRTDKPKFAGAIPVGFTYHYELLDKHGELVDTWVEHNLVPAAGLSYIANAVFGDVSPIGTFYVGLFANNYQPVVGAVASDIPGVIGEFVGYSQATRPVWNRVNTNGVISNVAARAEYTVTASARLYGGFLVSDSVKGAGNGLLLSVARFTSPKDVEPEMTLRVKAEISFIPTSVA